MLGRFKQIPYPVKHFLVTLFIVACTITVSFAQSDIPQVVPDGFESYRKSGIKAAVVTWLDGSALAGDTAQAASYVTVLSQAEAVFGKIVGFEPIRVIQITPWVQHIFILIRFEKAPMYISFECYKTDSRWIVTGLACDTTATKILPTNVYQNLNK